LQVNNAGVNFNFGSDNSVENAHKVIETNYYGTKRMIEAMIPLMKVSPAGGRIVNVSSRLGRLNGKRNVSNIYINLIVIYIHLKCKKFYTVLVYRN
jgi:NAD(P)-dependent dehydrogenase (short-subunit alcohol dehydrogenase family)